MQSVAIVCNVYACPCVLLFGRMMTLCYMLPPPTATPICSSFCAHEMTSSSTHKTM